MSHWYIRWYIFRMFTPRDRQALLDELGDKFPRALVVATDAARADYESFRRAYPDWVQGMFQREIGGIIHARIWAHLLPELEGVGGVGVRDREPYREVTVTTGTGRTIKIRVKRHSEDDQISSYPTPSDLAFWGGAVVTFDGMEEVPLAAGYRWLAETGEIGSPVISYREGKLNVVWAVELERGGLQGIEPVRYTEIAPTLPEVDLKGASGVEEKRAQ